MGMFQGWDRGEERGQKKKRCFRTTWTYLGLCLTACKQISHYIGINLIAWGLPPLSRNCVFLTPLLVWIGRPQPCCLLGQSHFLCAVCLLGFYLMIFISLRELLNASQFLHLGPKGRKTSKAILTPLDFWFICFKYLREPCDYCLFI